MHPITHAEDRRPTLVVGSHRASLRRTPTATTHRRRSSKRSETKVVPICVDGPPIQLASRSIGVLSPLALPPATERAPRACAHFAGGCAPHAHHRQCSEIAGTLVLGQSGCRHTRMSRRKNLHDSKRHLRHQPGEGAGVCNTLPDSGVMLLLMEAYAFIACARILVSFRRSRRRPRQLAWQQLGSSSISW